MKWVWAVVIGIALLMWYAFYVQIIGGETFGSNPAPDNVLIAFTIFFGVLFPIFILCLHMVTEVRSNGIYVRMSPLPGRYISKEEISSFNPRTYNALLEYGGWGIRFGFDGMAYNMSGNEGMRIVLSNGSTLLLGTHRAGEFDNALKILTGR